MSQVIQAKLLSHPDRPRHAFLREPCGRQELALSASCASTEAFAQVGARPGLDAMGVAKVLGELLLDWPGTALVPSSDVLAMSVSDRDRLLAALYRSCFGDLVECLAVCAACGKPYEVSFELSDMLHEQECAWPTCVEGPDPSGVYTTDNRAFRLPTVADEARAARLDPVSARNELLVACQARGSWEASILESMVERVGAVLAATLDSDCGMCGQAQPVEFDLQGFFVKAMQRERSLLAREVHCLALSYRWSHVEIMELPRSLRRAYVRLVLAERSVSREVLT